MKRRGSRIAVLMTAVMLLGYVFTAIAEEGNPKRGRVYFKMVCTVCHMTQTGKAVPPSSYTMEEWKKYLAADRHDASSRSNQSVRYYISKEYRESIKGENKAARKFINLPDEVLYADLHAFVVSGAKDSDTPASCE